MGLGPANSAIGASRPQPASSPREEALARARRLGHHLGGFSPDPAFGRVATRCENCGLHLAEYTENVVSGMALWLPCSA
jgi:hypothetical protein